MKLLIDNINFTGGIPNKAKKHKNQEVECYTWETNPGQWIMAAFNDKIQKATAITWLAGYQSEAEAEAAALKYVGDKIKPKIKGGQ